MQSTMLRVDMQVMYVDKLLENKESGTSLAQDTIDGFQTSSWVCLMQVTHK